MRGKLDSQAAPITIKTLSVQILHLNPPRASSGCLYSFWNNFKSHLLLPIPWALRQFIWQRAFRIEWLYESGAQFLPWCSYYFTSVIGCHLAWPEKCFLFHRIYLWVVLIRFIQLKRNIFLTSQFLEKKITLTRNFRYGKPGQILYFEENHPLLKGLC